VHMYPLHQDSWNVTGNFVQLFLWLCFHFEVKAASSSRHITVTEWVRNVAIRTVHFLLYVVSYFNRLYLLTQHCQCTVCVHKRMFQGTGPTASGAVTDLIIILNGACVLSRDGG
jgi:hypothetical protein